MLHALPAAFGVRAFRVAQFVQPYAVMRTNTTSHAASNILMNPDFTRGARL